MMINLEHLLML